jgi:thiamine biosynthesis protein ThiS
MTIDITLNGKPEQLQPGMTVTQLLEAKGVNPQRVAVELNRRILSRGEFPATELRPGDVVEVVTFVGGG